VTSIKAVAFGTVTGARPSRAARARRLPSSQSPPSFERAGAAPALAPTPAPRVRPSAAAAAAARRAPALIQPPRSRAAPVTRPADGLPTAPAEWASGALTKFANAMLCKLPNTASSLGVHLHRARRVRRGARAASAGRPLLPSTLPATDDDPHCIAPPGRSPGNMYWLSPMYTAGNNAKQATGELYGAPARLFRRTRDQRARLKAPPWDIRGARRPGRRTAPPPFVAAALPQVIKSATAPAGTRPPSAASASSRWPTLCRGERRARARRRPGRERQASCPVPSSVRRSAHGTPLAARRPSQPRPARRWPHASAARSGANLVVDPTPGNSSSSTAPPATPSTRARRPPSSVLLTPPTAPPGPGTRRAPTGARSPPVRRRSSLTPT
jgi:hypothetical protein